MSGERILQHRGVQQPGGQSARETMTDRERRRAAYERSYTSARRTLVLTMLVLAGVFVVEYQAASRPGVPIGISVATHLGSVMVP
jgi:hypothetical protein